MGDLIDFLERNVDGFESGNSDDDRFLQYGSFDELAGETDQADVLVGGQTYGGTGQP